MVRTGQVLAHFAPFAFIYYFSYLSKLIAALAADGRKMRDSRPIPSGLRLPGHVRRGARGRSRLHGVRLFL